MVKSDEEGFRREIYAQCFQDKRHYDLMSWTIGGAITLISTLLINQMVKLPDGPDDLWAKVGLAVAVALLSALWWSIYERNRFWGEVCNETARQIERELAMDGLAHAYMRGALLHKTTLRNVDIHGKPIEGAHGPIGPREEPDKSRRSMHVAVRVIIVAPAIAALGYAGYSVAIALA